MEATRADPSWVTSDLNDAYVGLRRQVFELTPTDIGIEPDTGPWGVLMEMGLGRAVVTLAAFATGDASLYFSTGGGVIGGVAHESVNEAAKRFVSTAQGHVAEMEPVTTYPLPALGQVRFYVLTPQGVLAVQAPERDLAGRKSDLAPLFYAGQDVITELRLVSERSSK